MHLKFGMQCDFQIKNYFKTNYAFVLLKIFFINCKYSKSENEIENQINLRTKDIINLSYKDDCKIEPFENQTWLEYEEFLENKKLEKKYSEIKFEILKTFNDLKFKV